MSIKEFLKKLGIVISLFLSGLITALFFSKKGKNDNEIKEQAEKKRAELKKTSASNIVDAYANKTDVQSGISKEQTEFRERIRNRLNKKL